jgi:hypothetical protein
MTPRRTIAVVGAAVSLVGVALADRFEAASFFVALAGGVLLGTAAAFTAVRARRETFAAPAVGFLLWIAPVLGVLFLWLVVAFEPPVD